MPRPSPQAHKLAMHQKTLQAGEAHVLSTRREELRSQLAEAEAAGVAAREALSAAKELRESLAARLTDFEGNRDERLKQSKAAIASAEKEAKASAKALEKAQQAEQKLRLQLQSLVDQTGAAEEALAETRKRSAEGEAELVEIEARVTAAKAAFDEATGGLKSHKEAQQAHEARLAQIGERREALEQEVADAEVELKQLEHRCSRAIKEKEAAEAMCRDLLSKNPWMEVRALARSTEREGRGGGVAAPARRPSLAASPRPDRLSSSLLARLPLLARAAGAVELWPARRRVRLQVGEACRSAAKGAGQAELAARGALQAHQQEGALHVREGAGRVL